MNELKARVIDSWVTSLLGFGLIMLSLGFIHLGDKVTAGVLVTFGVGLIAKKENKG